MSLSIRTHRVTAVYALGQWFSVRRGTLRLDAFELLDHQLLESDPNHGDYIDIYDLGLIYQSKNPITPDGFVRSFPDGAFPHWVNRVPSGSVGIQFIDDATGELVSFSILEIRALRELEQ